MLSQRISCFIRLNSFRRGPREDWRNCASQSQSKSAATPVRNAPTPSVGKLCTMSLRLLRMERMAVMEPLWVDVTWTSGGNASEHERSFAICRHAKRVRVSSIASVNNCDISCIRLPFTARVRVLWGEFGRVPVCRLNTDASCHIDGRDGG